MEDRDLKLDPPTVLFTHDTDGTCRNLLEPTAATASGGEDHDA